MCEHKSKANKEVKKAFYNAIRKYGFDNFKYEELITVIAAEKSSLHASLNLLERFYIKYYKDQGIILYNMSEGGDMICDNTGRVLTEE